MKILIDTSASELARRTTEHPDLVGGQLLTPLTGYKNAEVEHGIDNGCFTGFRKRAFQSLLNRNEKHKEKCLFVTCPDVVGNARRTLEIWKHRHRIISGWALTKLAFVAQDGMEDLEVPWAEIYCLFLGGNDPWKDSSHAIDLVKTAKTLGIPTHVGRVNEFKRFELFAEAGAATCDGSGIARYDHMLDNLASALSKEPQPTLFDGEQDESGDTNKAQPTVAI